MAVSEYTNGRIGMMSTQAEAWQIMNLGLGMTYGKGLRARVKFYKADTVRRRDWGCVRQMEHGRRAGTQSVGAKFS